MTKAGRFFPRDLQKMAAEQKGGKKTVKRLEIKEENYTFLQQCAVYVADGNK